MDLSPKAVLAYARTPMGIKSIKYAAVSAVAIVVSLSTLGITYGVLRQSKTVSQIAAVIVSTIPSYWLNRSWVWGKVGKSHLWREVMPFWAISVFQFAVSLLVVNWLGGIIERRTEVHLYRTLGIQFISLATYGVMWIAKFVFLNKVLFVHRHHPEPAPVAN